MLCTLWDPIVFTYMEYIKSIKNFETVLIEINVSTASLDFCS